jgi:hypothetical protein
MKGLFCLSLCGLTTGVFVGSYATVLHADVILDPPNLKGTIGLTGETFSSAYVYASWEGGEVDTSLPSGDTDFALRVEPGKTSNLRVRMLSFQDTPNALIDQYIDNVAPIGEGQERNLSLVRDAGRIHGNINVVAGSVKNIYMYSFVQPTGSEEYTERYYGYDYVSLTPVEAVQPMPALPNTRVYGNAVLVADAGCEVPVNLDPQYVTVPSGDTVNVTWDFDLSNTKCSGIQGEVSLPGLDGDNADVSLNRHDIHAWQGATTSFNEQLSEDGSYIFPSLVEGTCWLYLTSSFDPPYGYVRFPYETASLAEEEVTTHDFLKPVGTLHGSVALNGIWGLSDVSYIRAWFRQNSGWTLYPDFYDQVDLTSGAFDIVAPVGVGYLHYIQPYFYEYDTSGYVSEQYWRYYDTEEQSPIQVNVAEGDRLEGYTVELKTSRADVGVHLPDPDVSIKQLRITSNDEVHAPITDTLLGRREIKLSSNLTDPCNGMIVPIRGEVGRYHMTAVADGDDGGTYSKDFELELVAPQATPPSHELSLDFATEDGAALGSVTFANVTDEGYTGINVSTSGPRPPENSEICHRCSMDDVAKYYDIRSTATFDGDVTVCLNYDDSKFSSEEEPHLQLKQHVCATSSYADCNADCGWEDITNDDAPDTASNVICGNTSTLSIFAIFEPHDQDGDGIFDDEDNCVAVANAGQEDLDHDGVGDVCDPDDDNDGIEDTADNCPFIVNSDQLDTDNDGTGDVCDPNDDNDDVLDGDDNCPFVANADQKDIDHDGVGDACDPDDDGDGVDDTEDQCIATALGDSVNQNGCSLPQLCPCENDWKNHGKYVSCVAHAVRDFYAAGFITAEQKRFYVSTAAKSQCGHKKPKHNFGRGNKK